MAIKKIYHQSCFPVLQNRVYDSKIEAINCVIGDIEIVEDLETGLVYNSRFQSELLIYDDSYNNEQGLSNRFQEHLTQVVKIVEIELGKEALLEVGCGKGLFLEMLLARGCDVIGFDPTYSGNNARVIKKHFEPGIFTKPARGLILRHVLEHIPDPVNFLFQLQVANEGQGLVYIEVPCFEWICKNRAWFDIFYEHVNYFRLSDFERMFGRIVDSGHIFGGQYLYIVAELATLRVPWFDASKAVSFPKDFLSSLYSDKITKQQNPVCLWGGASKGVIFSLMLQRIHVNVDFVIDVNPEKQGKFLPLSGIKVVSPQDAIRILPSGATIFVMNQNYLQEIREMSMNKFNYVSIH